MKNKPEVKQCSSCYGVYVGEICPFCPRINTKKEEVKKAIAPFVRAFQEAHNVISEASPHRESHILRAVTYWLSYNNFSRLEKLLMEIDSE